MHERNWIHQVDEGMDVYDANGDKVGMVESFRYGTPGDTEPVADNNTDDSLLENIADALSPGDIPAEVRERLLQQGYIRIDKGILQGFGYVPNSNIQTVDSEGVHLNIPGDGIVVRR
jgi:hypothetical protein